MRSCGIYLWLMYFSWYVTTPSAFLGEDRPVRRGDPSAGGRRGQDLVGDGEGEKRPGSPLSCPRSSRYWESLCVVAKGVRTGAPTAAPPDRRGSPLPTHSSATRFYVGGRWPEIGWKRGEGTRLKNGPSCPLAAPRPAVSSVSLSFSFLLLRSLIRPDRAAPPEV